MGRMGKGGSVEPPDGVSDFIHRAIYLAVEQNRLVEIDEPTGKTRIGEPHDYGVLNSKPTVLFYQRGGYSRSGGLPQWRHLDVTKFRAVRPLDKTFRGGRDTETGQHRDWDQLFIRAKP
jgi:hypothetical protein